MNKKAAGLFLGVIFLGTFIAGCGNNEQEKKDLNYFGGTGEIKNAERLNGLSGLYDDENKYFDNGSEAYWKLDKDGMLTVNCQIASCPHEDESCEAFVSDGEYFVFNGKLYKSYNEAHYNNGGIEDKGYIWDCDTGKVVFDNPVPKEMDADLAVDDSTSIFYVRVLSDDILKVEGHRHAYLLNRDFEVLYWYSDVGKFPWGMIYENQYYYVNDLYKLVKVDLETKESKMMEWDGKVFACDNDNENIYFSNEFEELNRYSLKDGSTEKLADDMLMFSVHNGYIYGGSGTKKCIYDVKGKFIADYTEYQNMDAATILCMNGKMYSWFEGGIAEMSPDGKNYKEYILE